MAAANNNSTKSSKHKPLICSSQKTASILSTIKKFLLSLRIEQQSTVENFIIIWLDTNIDIHPDEYNSIKSHFQNLVHLILPFNDSDRCIDFITDTKNEKIFLIMSGLLGRTLAPVIHDFSQIDSIYIYCNNRARHEKWADKEKKIKGVFQDIGSIYDAVRRDKRQCEDNLSSFSILSSTFNKNKKLNQLDQLFIYTHLLKDILIELEYKPNTKIDFVNFCCSKYLMVTTKINKIYFCIRFIFQSEKEILFTTHTIFRIHTIDQIENGLWQIQLKLTTNENEQLKYFKHLLRKEIENKTGPERLNILMTKLQMFHGSKSIEKAQSTEMEFEQHVHENVYHKQTKKTSQSTVNNKMEQPVKESLCHEPTEKTGQLMANSETKQNVDENVYQRPTTGTSQSTAIDKIEQLVEENACHAQTRKKSELVANDEIEEHVEGKIRYEQTNEMSQSTATENIEQSFKENVCDEQTNEISQLTANSETKQNVDENVYHRPTTGTSQSTAIDKIEQPVEVKIHHEKSNETSQLTANSETKQNVGENVYPEQTKETSQSLFSDEIKLEHSPVVTDVIGEQPVNRLQSASDV
ncbi:unnamed protein product [Rotaria sp. Silwood2]|nr:unnamed protein product [Rotaria sp. Silwood2]CAF4206148.1 unnamed protein product [Rotaria sp. Silwood2]